MSLDRTSEAIAHFSGLFEKTVEEARLRQEYTEFKADQKKEAENTKFEFSAPRMKSKHSLEDYDPDGRKLGKNPEISSENTRKLPETPATPAVELAPTQGQQELSQFIENGSDGAASFGGGMLLPFVPVPASVVTITLQSILLHDNDIYGDVQQAGFIPLEFLHAQFAAVIELAEALAPWSNDSLAQNILSDPDAVHAFREELKVLASNSDSFIHASIATDEAVLAITVNGETVEEMPELDDLLPSYIKAKRDAENDKTALEEAEKLAGHSKGSEGLFEGLDGLVDSFAMSGHNVTAGANEAHNVVDVKTAWFDAATIVVGGDYVSLNAISQSNFLSDRNFVDGYRQNDAESAAVNIASVSEEAVARESGSSLAQPEVWNIVHYEGDVTVTNLVKQHTLISDNDQLQLTFTANSTSLVSGENKTFNLAQAAEAGFDYDLVFVGGSMVSANVVNQTNILLDDDYFSGPGLSHAAISDGDNLLHNKVNIHKKGADTQIEMANDFKDALQNLTEASADLMAAIVQNTLFQGKEALKVLKIDGNLTQLNVVDQVNYLADQDQVQMAQDAMQSAIDNIPVAITTGSNLLSNETIIEASGFDSKIMAAGGYYNDALLYQAELVDTDADPLGVSIAELANEAVAFLADDMIAKTVSEKLEAAGFNNDVDGGYSLDVMQTMTA